jgi:hypothetical protein
LREPPLRHAVGWQDRRVEPAAIIYLIWFDLPFEAV